MLCVLKSINFKIVIVLNYVVIDIFEIVEFLNVSLIREIIKNRECRMGECWRFLIWIWEIEYWIRKDLIFFLLFWEVLLLYFIGFVILGDVVVVNVMECWYIVIIMILWFNVVNLFF